MSLAYRLKSTLRLCAMKSDTLVRLVRALKGRTSGREAAAAIIQERGLAFAEEVVCALGEAGIEVFLSSGSLLGVVREGRLLPHDDDIDFMVWTDQPGFGWDTVEHVLGAQGWKLRCWYSLDGDVIEQTYDSGLGFLFDIFGLVPADGGQNLRSFYFAQRKDRIYDSKEDMSVWYTGFPLFRQTRLLQVQGHMVKVPQDAESVLVANYGPDWRVPDAGWNPKDALTYIPDMLGKRHCVQEDGRVS